ncbi:MAG TPA: GNAT family N-acetyltransferase [Cellvibrio sp.]|nr:GNAT family N-acetyltransferase [Cellvibrio sp.]
MEDINTLLETSSVVLVDEFRLPLVNRFYADCKYKVKCGRNDRVYSISLNGNMIAAARLLPQADNSYLLRNLCVASQWRRRGVASYFLKKVLADLPPHDCYCYALFHLKLFYIGLGFQVFSADQVPQDIGEVYRRHQQRNRDWILMGYIHGGGH